MKKSLFSIVLSAVFFLALAFTACNRSTKEIQPDASASKQNVRNNKSGNSPLHQLTYHRIGNIHNALLNRMTTTYDFTVNHTTNSATANAVATNVCNSIQTLEGWGCNELPVSVGTVLTEILDANYQNNVVAGWDNYTNQILPLLTQREQNLVNQARLVLFANFDNKTRSQIAQTIQQGADALIAVHASTNWNQNEGNFSGGLLQIMRSSAIYWENPNLDLPGEGGLEVEGIWITVAIDAVGFAAGFLNNWWTAGELNGWSATGSGLIIGAAASCIRYIGLPKK